MGRPQSREIIFLGVEVVCAPYQLIIRYTCACPRLVWVLLLVHLMGRWGGYMVSRTASEPVRRGPMG
jgi:hypothetical protein